MNTVNQQNNWRKNPMVWMVIFFPSLAIVSGFFMLYIAIKTDDGLVDSEYYKQGMGINKTIHRDLTAIEKNITGLMSINAQTGSIQTRFSNDVDELIGQSISFKLVHRTIPGFDQQIMLNRVDDTLLYAGKINPLPQSGGRWRWEINHEDWRISERFTTRSQEVVVLSFPKTTP